MNNWEPERVRKIWQRVQHQKTTQEVPLAELFGGEMTDSNSLFRIAGNFPNGDRLRKIAREDQKHAMMIKNTFHFMDRPKSQPQQRQHPKLMLQQCYERKLQRLAVYQGLQSHPQWGELFRNLARQEQRHCHILLEYLKPK